MPGKPEILAPCGDMPSLRAALAAGADAVYFGLDEGFNARDRATNMSLERLPEIMAEVHCAGARAYLTLNTLVFEPELPRLEGVLARVAEAGVDAIIVQDPAVALLARAVCPDLEIHASTQMTVSSPEGARFAKSLGATRVVVPRELSVDEIRHFAASSELELEVFIHGALCVSWSGQCLTSEAWGGRSANRGQCAQSCRMPYDLVVDGQVRDLGDIRYLLSPQDLAGAAAMEALVESGVHCLKIEGRLKGPEYVATAVEGYRRWRDAVLAGPSDADKQQLGRDLAAMALTYSRGFTSGFLAGSDHQTLVEGRFPKTRGVYLGRVVAVRGDDVYVARDPEGRPWTGALAMADHNGARPSGPHGSSSAPLPSIRMAEVEPRPGMGVVFDAGNPEDPHEPGGRIFRVDALAPQSRVLPAGGWIIGFGRPGPDLGRVSPGQRLWITRDPQVTRHVERLLAVEPTGRHPVDIEVRGHAGEPLVVRALCGLYCAEVTSQAALAEARGAGLTEELLASKLGALGGTPLRLGRLDASGLAPGLHLPVSELKELRRSLVTELVVQIERGSRLSAAGAAKPADPGGADTATPNDIAELPFTTVSAVEMLRARARQAAQRPAMAWTVPEHPQLVPLCRNDAQLEAVIDLGLPEVELDWMEFVGLGRAFARARAAGLRVTVATTRVQKVGEEGFDARIQRLQPDGVLVRHWGAVMTFRDEIPGSARPVLHGDFSLNVTSSITAGHLFALGLDTLTASHDLDATQLFALLAQVPGERFTVTVHHHIPTFHTEHCVYAHLLSSGRDYRSCGRPCERHEVSLRDRVGLVHPVLVDVGCRNTVFNAQAQSAAGLLPELIERGVRRFRVELVREDRREAQAVLAAYQDLLAGRISSREALRRAGGHEQFGVTRGTMRVIA